MLISRHGVTLFKEVHGRYERNWLYWESRRDRCKFRRVCR